MKREVETFIYYYFQNNSGGSFDYSDRLTNNLYIEATSAQHADQIAESLGVYFNGCSSGLDCPCCGDRWSTAWSPVSKDFSSKEEVKTYVIDNTYSVWTDKYPHSRIFFLDGQVIDVWERKESKEN